MTRILLIDPSYREARYLQQRDVYPHTGLLTLGTVLRQAGHTVKVVHLIADNVTDLPAIVKEFKPDIAGVTMVTFQLKSAYETLKAIKSVSKGIFTLVGGPHASAIPLTENTRLDFLTYADGIVRGEGENLFIHLASNGGFRPQYFAGSPKDINQLPELDLSLTDINNFAGIYPPGPLPSLPMIASRGCPYNCGFCSKSVFGKQVRFRSPQLIINELIHWVELGIREVFFQDDTFNCNLNYCHELLDLILSNQLNKDLVFRARLRANEKLISEALLTQMKRANFRLIFYGVESGSQAMLDTMSKGLRLEEIKRAFQLTRKAGIETEASFIIGMPGETEATIKDSLRFYRELKPDWCSFNRAIPFPGTEFEKHVRQHGQLKYEYYEDYRLNETLVRTDALDFNELERWAVIADNAVEKSKAMYLLRKPKELFGVVREAGIKRTINRVMRLAR